MTEKANGGYALLDLDGTLIDRSHAVRVMRAGRLAVGTSFVKDPRDGIVAAEVSRLPQTLEGRPSDYLLQIPIEPISYLPTS